MTNRPFFFFFSSSFFLNAALSYLYVWVKILTTFSKKEQRVTTRLRIHYTCTLSLSGPAKNKIMNLYDDDDDDDDDEEEEEVVKKKSRRRRRRPLHSLSFTRDERERERERDDTNKTEIEKL